MSREFRITLPPAEELRRLFSYDPMTGSLTWRVKPCRRISAGVEAGTKSRGYTIVRLDREAFAAHRIIWKMMTSNEPPEFIDHEDGDKGNNSWRNLREATCAQNAYNSKPRASKSGVKGVSWHKGTGKWVAVIKVQARTHYLGVFSTVAAAATAVAAARQRLHGEFARAA